VALGKLLGVLTFFSLLMLPLWLYQIVIFSAANPPLPWVLTVVANGAVLLVAAAILSLGMFISSLTDSAIVAYILTFVSVFSLWIVDVFARRVGGTAGEVIAYLSLFQPYTDLVGGLIKSQALVLFGSYIFAGIFLTAQSIETLRFQRS
jgi:ABC-2 type transport system permease protein